MADGPSGERTEQPTAKRLTDARNRGDIAKSKDLSAALGLLVAILLLKYGGYIIAHYTRLFTVRVLSLEFAYLEIPEGREILPLLAGWGIWLILLLFPFLLLLALFVYIADVLQVGFMFTTEPLKIKFDKLNPISGLKRLFSLQNIMTLLMNISKLAIIMPIAWYTIIGELKSVIVLLAMEPTGIFIYKTNSVLNLALLLACLLLVLGLADYIWQKRQYIKKLKMTKQEVKEEYKQMEGDPKIKGKRRQKQMEMAMQRMMKEVPQAEVVVRNPTHFAVAISYKPEMPAPMVVAKGADKMAERIIAEARKAGVPLVENPPLARELYKKVEVGEEIPPELFATIAELLAHVLRGEKREKLMKAFAGAAA